MIITVGNTKGGVGKSTIATNLACMAADRGQDALLADCDDPQQTSSVDFTALREANHADAPKYTCIQLAGPSVRTELLKMKPKHDMIIIDAGGRDTSSLRAALTISDIILIPIQPRTFAVFALENMVNIIDEIRTVNPDLQAYAFINSADPPGKGTDNDDAIKAIQERPSLTYIDTPLGNRKAFAHAVSQGLAVTELKKPFRDIKAAAEMETLFQRCFDITPILVKARA
ncbi:MAG: AAA family ATPase [Nitrospiraceae bacterium]